MLYIDAFTPGLQVIITYFNIYIDAFTPSLQVIITYFNALHRHLHIQPPGDHHS
jgi:hypothetical protein